MKEDIYKVQDGEIKVGKMTKMELAASIKMQSMRIVEELIKV